MITYELTEIDSWQVLPFEDFAPQVIQELIRRFQGVHGHTFILWDGLLREGFNPAPMLQPINIVCNAVLEALRNIRQGLLSHQIVFTSRELQSEFLKMLVTDITPIADNFGYFIGQLPQSDSKDIASSLWNIQDNNLVRLRHLLTICNVYRSNMVS